MAINPPYRAYGGGAVEFNTNPTLNMTYQLLQRKKAQEDALDNYERDRLNRINDTGVRDQDREGFDNRIMGLRQYFQKNKDNIRKGTTPQAYEYEKMFRDVKSYINESKNRTSLYETGSKFYNDRLKADQRLPDDFMTEIQANEMPLDAEGSSSFNVGKWMSTSAPKFDQKKYLSEFADIKREQSGISYQPIEGDKFRKMEITTETFSPESKDKITARAVDKYNNSWSFSEHIKSLVSDPEQKKALDEVFVKEYGDVPKGMQDYAAAYTLSLLPTTTTKSKSIADQEALMKERDRIAMKHIYANKASGGGTGGQGSGIVGNVFDTVEDGKFGDFEIKGGIFLNKDGGIIGSDKEETVKLGSQNIPSTLMSVLKSGGIDPKYLLLGVEAKIKNGEIQSISNKYIGTITRQAMEGVYQPKFDTEPQKAPHLQYSDNKPKETPKPVKKGKYD